MEEKLIDRIINNQLTLQIYFLLNDMKIDPYAFFEDLSTGKQYLNNLLEPVFHFGMLEVLLPLNLLIREYYDSEVNKWWTYIIEEMDTYSAISCFENSFSEYVLSDVKMLYPERETSILDYSDSGQGMYNHIWSMYSSVISALIQKVDRQFATGLILPGVYNSYIDNQLIKLIQTTAVPALSDASKRNQNSYEKAVSKRIITAISSELFGRYILKLNFYAYNASKLTEEEMAQLSSAEYHNLVFPENNSSITSMMNEQWLNSLIILNDLVTKYQISMYSSTAGKYCLPQFHQYVQHDETALECLDELWSECNAEDKSVKAVLVAAYRALAKHRFAVHTSLYLTMKKIWEQNGIPRKAKLLLEDILDFFIRYHSSLDCLFEASDNLQTELKITYSSLFQTNLLQIYLMKKSEFVKNEGHSLSERLLALNDIITIFSNMTSHLNDEHNNRDVRILLKSCLKNLGYSADDCPDEVFHAYTGEQTAELFVLNQRCAEIRKSLPDFGAVLLYERIKGNLAASYDSALKINKIEETVEELELQQRIAAVFSSLSYSVISAEEISGSKLIQYLLNNPDKAKEFSDILLSALNRTESVEESIGNDVQDLARLLNDVSENRDKYVDKLKQELIAESYSSTLDALPGVSIFKNMYSAGKSFVDAAKLK